MIDNYGVLIYSYLYLHQFYYFYVDLDIVIRTLGREYHVKTIRRKDFREKYNVSYIR
jgi:hypothetical protein